jgi:hypothetical protein
MPPERQQLPTTPASVALTVANIAELMLGKAPIDSKAELGIQIFCGANWV